MNGSDRTHRKRPTRGWREQTSKGETDKGMRGMCEDEWGEGEGERKKERERERRRNGARKKERGDE